MRLHSIAVLLAYLFITAALSETLEGNLPLWPALQTPPATSNEEAKKLANQLGHNDFKVREVATEKIKQLGGAARGALGEAAKSKDPEMAERASQLLQNLPAIDAPPGTSKELAEVFYRFQKDKIDERMSIYIPHQFNFINEETLPLLELLAAGHPSPKARQELVKRLQGEPTVLANRAILDGDIDRAIALWVGACEVNAYSAQTLAFLIYLQNPNEKEPVETVVAALRKKYSISDKCVKLLTMHLTYSRGDISRAAAIAEADLDIFFGLHAKLRCEAGEWDLAAAAYEKFPERDSYGPPAVPLAALCYRFNGETAKATKLVDAAVADFKANKQSVNPHYVLMGHDRVDDVVSKMVQDGDPDPRVLKPVWRFHEMEEAAKPVMSRPQSIHRTEPLLRVAQVLDELGETQKVKTILSSINDPDTIGRNVNRLGNVYESLAIKVGLLSEYSRPYFEDIPGANYSENSYWTLYFDSEKPDPKLIRSIRDMLENKLPREQMTKALRDAAIKASGKFDAIRSGYVVEIGLYTTLKRLDRLDMAPELFSTLAEKNGKPELYAFAGDASAARGKFAEALDCYLRAAVKSRDKASLLWRAGLAADKVGKPEGREMMSRASLLAHSDLRGQRELARVMRDLGRDEEADRQELLMTKSTSITDRFWGSQAFMSLRDRAIQKGDFTAALSYHKIAIAPSGGASQGAAELHRLSAIVAANEKQFDTAIAESTLFLNAAPPDPMLFEKVTAALRAAGQHTQAENLLKKAIDRVEPITKDYPNFKPAAEILAALRKLQAK